jgi:hypothetical protein
MTETRPAAAVPRFATPTEVIRYVLDHGLSEAEAEPIFEANGMVGAWPVVEEARAAEQAKAEADAKIAQLQMPGRQVAKQDSVRRFGGESFVRRPEAELEPKPKPNLAELFHLETQRKAERKATDHRKQIVLNRILNDDLKHVSVSPTLLINNLPAVVEEAVPNTFLGRQVASLVDVMNLKHAIIGNIGGKYRVLDWVPSEFDPSVLIPSFQSQEDFKKRYNDQVPTEAGLMKRGELWLTHRNRAQYDQIGFLPGSMKCVVVDVEGVITTILNTWRGFPILPEKGDWSRLQWHVRHILARGDPVREKYILDWTAAGLQHPDKKRRVCVVFLGDEGVGKGLFGHALLRMYGAHGFYISQPSQLTGNFNNHLWHVCFVFADEAFFAGDRQAEAILKSLITEDSMTIEPKFVNAFRVKNMLDVMIASNDKWAVPVHKHGRRFAVFDVDGRFGKGMCSDADREAYFKPLWEEINGGGIAAMMHDLLARDLSGWNPEAFPITPALVKQKQQTLRGFDKAFEAWLQTGVLPRNRKGPKAEFINFHTPPNCATTEAMLDYVKDLRGCEHETDTNLKSYLKEWKFPQSDDQLIYTAWRVGGDGHAGAKFPALADCRAAFAATFGVDWPWDTTVIGWSNEKWSERERG